MSAGTATLLALVVAYVLALVALWWIDHPATRDPGGYAENWRQALRTFYRWPFDKAKHAGAAALLGFLTSAALSHAGYHHPRLAAIALVMFAGLGIECIEWRPRHPYAGRRRGRFSKWDLAADLLGALVGAAAAGAL